MQGTVLSWHTYVAGDIITGVRYSIMVHGDAFLVAFVPLGLWCTLKSTQIIDKIQCFEDSEK